MQEFRDKTAFVTGGASGIGFALTRAFLDEGMNVVVADIEDRALADALARLKAYDNRVRGVRCDVSDRASVAAAAREAFAAFGKVHVVCNNAGVGGGGPFETVEPARWDWVLGVNLLGVVNGIAAFLPHIKAHGEGGHFLNTASMAGLNGSAFMSPYCASKSAVVAITESLAAELAGTGVGATVLCPGWVRTRIFESARNMPAEVAALPPREITPAMMARGAEIVGLIAAGTDPDEIAARSLAAIRDGDLYVFTHLDMRFGVEERFAAIRAAFDKAARFVPPPRSP